MASSAFQRDNYGTGQLRTAIIECHKEVVDWMIYVVKSCYMINVVKYWITRAYHVYSTLNTQNVSGFFCQCSDFQERMIR